MKGLKTTAVSKKSVAHSLKVQSKTAKKNPGAPKRPPSAYFVFMEDFRKTYKENFPENKLVSAVAKAGGEKWRSMSDSEKAPFAEKAMKRKTEYGKALEAFNKNQSIVVEDAASEKTCSEVHDDGGQEASS